MKELMSTPGWEMFVLLFSGLGLFLYGMNLMSEGLEKAAGNRLKSIVGALTTNRYIPYSNSRAVYARHHPFLCLSSRHLRG